MTTFFPEDEGGRPLVDPYDTQYKFAPGDKVYLRDGLDGSYLIKRAEGGRYSLCDFAYETVKGG